MHISKAPKIDLQPCESSQIHSFGHCPDTSTLRVRFKGKDGPGKTYDYPNTSRDTFLAMRSAESVGKFFGQNIKPLANHILLDETPLEEEQAGSGA